MDISPTSWLKDLPVKVDCESVNAFEGSVESAEQLDVGRPQVVVVGLDKVVGGSNEKTS